MQEKNTDEKESRTVFHVDPEEYETDIKTPKKEKGGKKLGFVILFIVVISLALGYAFSYFIHHRPAEYGDRDSSTHEIYVRESKELSYAVKALGRDTSDIDALIEQYRKAASKNGTFYPRTYVERLRGSWTMKSSAHRGLHMVVLGSGDRGHFITSQPEKWSVCDSGFSQIFRREIF